MFRRPSVRYGRTPEPETPYQRGPGIQVTSIKSKQLRLPAECVIPPKCTTGNIGAATAPR
jgi:hypothetical protein